MSTPLSNTTVHILGKPYAVRCPEHEVAGLQAAALYIDQQMQQVQASGKAINLERIAIITAVNVAYQFLQSNEEKSAALQNINERLSHLQDKIDASMSSSHRLEPLYSLE
jgi:cell division protein ZapA